MKQIKLTDSQYQILQEIIELATRLNYDRNEVESLLDNVETIEEPTPTPTKK